MHGAGEFLEALTIVLGVAAVTTVLFQRLHQPVVLGYILAGLIIGPHVPIPLVADAEVVHTLSELGVILLMFSIGLEFSFRRLAHVGPSAGLTALIQCSLMVWLGFVAGRAFGWTGRESLYTGAIIAISSTTIIAKAFDEQGVESRLRGLVIGILIVEDLVAILILATFTTVSSGAGLSAGAIAATTGRLAAFLFALVAVGLLVVPRAFRWIHRFARPETLLVASVGLCFAVALLAKEVGYSVALGAFLAGSLVAESGHEKEIEHLVEPLRDVFAAVFFVSVGMLIEPALVAEHWVAVVVLTLVVVVGKIGSVSFGAFLAGSGVRTSVQAGMSLAQIGEFSFIIAGLGLSLGATREFLYPVAVAVSAITTLTTPWLIRAADPVASWVERKLPKPIQTFVTFYERWALALRGGRRRETTAATVRRLARLLVLDGAVLAALIIGTSVSLDRTARFFERAIDLGAVVSRVGVVAGAAVLALPFCVGIVRLARRMGLVLAAAALPDVEDTDLELAAARSRTLVVFLQLGVILLIGTPIVAVTQPFLSGFPGALVLGAALVLLGVAFWRSAEDLSGRARGGVAAIVDTLAAQTRAPATKTPKAPAGGGELATLAADLGAPTPLRIDDASPAVSKTLGQLDLRGRTGATVLAITRDGERLVLPKPDEVLRAGDVLTVAGSTEAVAAARILLKGGDPPSD